MGISKQLISGLLILLTSSSCQSPDFYDSKEFNELIVSPGIKIFDTIHFDHSEIYHLYQDEGALGGHSFYLFHKKNSNKYHHFLYNGHYWKNYILEPCGGQGEVLNSGKWVEIKGTKSNIEYSFIPNIDSSLSFKVEHTELKEGIYLLLNDDLVWHGKLSDFCSFEDLSSGLYYLTSPSFLYKSKTDIKDIEKKYD